MGASASGALRWPLGRTTGSPDGRTEEAREAFRAHVEEHSAHELDALAEELEHAPPTALMCLEAEPAECHRRVVAECLRARLAGLEVVDL